MKTRKSRYATRKSPRKMGRSNKALNKARRNPVKERDSATSNQRAESQSINLAAVGPKYRAVAAKLCKNPRKFNGQVVLLKDSTRPKRANDESVFEPPKLKDCTRGDFLTCFNLQRQAKGLLLPVVLYLRVSSDGQALNGTSLQAMCRSQLEKCAANNFLVVAIAVDVESGRVDDRRGLKAAIDLIHKGVVRCLVVPVISRLERDETNFGARMAFLATCESWVYYGQTYQDRGFDYVHWNDFEARHRAVNRVREAEQYVAEMVASVRNSDQNKLHKGYLLSPQKKDNFLFYKVHIHPAKRALAAREIIPRAHAKRHYKRIRKLILKARDKKDADCLTRILQAESRRIGDEVTLEDFEWELGIGWIVGLNKRGPASPPELTASCPWLTLVNDPSEHAELLQAIDDLKALRRRNRSPGFSSLEIEAYRQAQLAEVQENEQQRIALRWTCNCNGRLKAIKCLGKASHKDSKNPQDWGACPSCGTKTGTFQKVRLPRKADYRVASKLPSEMCTHCGKFGATREDTPVIIGAMRFPVYRCTDCMKAWRGEPTSIETIQKPAPLSQTTGKRSRKRVRERVPQQVPKGVPRKLWDGAVPEGKAYHSDLAQSKIARRMADALRQHGMTYCFTTWQLRSIGIGGEYDFKAPRNVVIRMNHAYAIAKHYLLTIGITTMAMRIPGTMNFVMWTTQAGATKAAP